MNKFWILLPLIICRLSFAQMNYDLKAGYRSTPAGNNIAATAQYDSLLWGAADKEKPWYGYYSVGFTLGGAPTAAAFVQVAPIAPLIFELQKSATYRFSNSAVFDCDRIYCFGVSDRTEASATILGGYGNIVGFITTLWKNIRLPDSSNPVLSELEYFAATPGEHFYNETTAALAYRLDEEKSAGIVYSSGRFSEGDRKTNSAYGVFRWKWQELDLTGGLGQYNSDQPGIGGTSFIFAIGKKFGECLSLF